MGIGKQKAHAKAAAKKLAKLKNRNNNAKIIAVHRANDIKLAGSGAAEEEAPSSRTGREKHHAKVQQKRAIREMLNYKKIERSAIKKSTVDGDEKSQRRALCAEIKVLKETMVDGGATDEMATAVHDGMADEA